MKKNKYLFLGMLAIVLVFGLSVIGCDPGTGGGDGGNEKGAGDEADTYTVTFNSNGGSAVAAKSDIESDTTIALPEPPTKTGYAFSGWYTDNETFENEFTVSTSVTADITVYAKWTSTTSSEDILNILFSDDFAGTSLNTAKWNVTDPMDRQGRSTWMEDMVSVSDGYLHLKFKKDPELGTGKANGDKAIENNWIRSGAVRTRSRDWNRFLWENNFGYYEARIKFPKVAGIWGAFWLMSPTLEDNLENGGEEGTEIDIVETIQNNNNAFQSALHWNGYGDEHQSVGSGEKTIVNIYDGQFHTFALDWSSTEYVFYVDGIEYWRVDGGEEFNNCGINQNPNYIKLTVESATWAGDIPNDFTEDEMVVDYVKVYKEKPSE
jgi:uncharacterized repeat protein (TIGR02543 family)